MKTQTFKNRILGSMIALAIFLFADPSFVSAATVSSPLKMNEGLIEQASDGEKAINQTNTSPFVESLLDGNKSVKKNKRKMMMGKCPM
ncbi:MAG: hypothetical protein HY351_04095 [Candidatus Omnitrophica bacterium]|nr:hypothetical protein [Candidatus Omnitrophota bacterium]